MKKHVMFMAAATSLALASCSNDHDVELNHGSEICFRTAFEMPHHGGRGAEITTVNDLGDIVVTAIDERGDIYFQNVTFNGTDGSYASLDKYYWPNDGRKLKFTACQKDQKDVFFETNGTTLKDIVPAANWDNHQDLVYCQTTETAKPADNAGVALQFNHAMAQIELRGKNTGVYVVEVRNAKIAKVTSSGKFDIPTGTWTPNAGTISYTGTQFGPVTLDNTAKSLMGVTNEAGKATNGNAMIIPQTPAEWNNGQGAYLALEVRIRTNYNNKSSWVYPAKTEAYNAGDEQDFAWVAVALPTNTKWEAGKRYIYTLDFKNGAGYTEPSPTPDPENPPVLVLNGEISLSVAMTGWDAVTTSDINAPSSIRRK